LKGLRKGIRLLLACALLPAQPSASVRQSNVVDDLWLSRARSLTEELVKDSDALRRNDRALLLARLGRMWQQDDRERAGDWIEKALRVVEAVPNAEGRTERSQRLRTARGLLVILGAKDEGVSARLSKVLSGASEGSTPNTGRDEAAAKAEAGAAVADSNPQRALQLGLESLRAGGSYKLSSLIWRLRKRDVKLSDTLFLEVVAAAQARNYDPELLGILPVVAFEGPAPSDKLRDLLLGALAEGLLRLPGPTEEQTAPCRLATLAAPLLPEFQRLTPQRVGMVRAQIARCQPTLNPVANKEAGDALQDRQLNTADALLEEAGKASDVDRRVTYLIRAADKAYGEQQYERALGILDNFNGGEHEAADGIASGLWESKRTEFASAAAMAHFRQGDLTGMYRVIAETPANLRAYVQMEAAAELVKKDGAAATQLLNEARAALVKTGSFANFIPHLTLARLFSTLKQPDALPSLADAVKAMNQAERSPQGRSPANEAEAQIPLLSNDIMLGLYNLPVSLLDADELGTMQTIAAAESPTRRAAMRLSLLRASLERHHASATQSSRKTKGQASATP
jgi:hypothetical protein